jgi:hypothetical protein
MEMVRFEYPVDGLLQWPQSVPGARFGSVFVLAAGGLRRLHGRGEGFLGYSAGEMFWRDVLEFVHEEDLPHAEDLIYEVVRNPGTSLSARLRFTDASGGWRSMDACFQNVLEAPGDTGLVVVNVCDAYPGGQDSLPFDRHH